MITREDMVEQSVQNYTRAALADRGYGDDVALLESFPYRDLGPEIDKTYLAFGFGFDDEGEAVELGSDLLRKRYTIQMWVFGPTNTWARNVANVVKFALNRDETMPLLDISQDGSPEIDKLLLDGVTAERQYIPDPEPWQEFVWTVHLQVLDEYHASLI